MEEIEVWFERELAPYGFNLTPTMYDPLSFKRAGNYFTPMRGVMYTYPDGDQNRTVLLRTRITPELANDLQGWGRTYEDDVNDYREMVIVGVIREVVSMGHPNPFDCGLRPIDFTPKRKITKLRFND
jgi:hypothetical protein